MDTDSNAEARPVVVVTGGGAGIGAAIAEAVGRSGAYVVTVDSGVTVDGLGQDEAPAETTADRIVAAGGAARASNASVTDAAAIDALFTALVDEFGGLEAVINVAGISRPTGFAQGDEQAWESVLSVHLDGYLNVLRSALPIMTAAGRGRILGVTSGSGWRAADAGAYSCAKRAVAALTWQLGKVAPSGVTVNALSPIAATRMVTAGLAQQAPASGGDQGQTGGVSLAIAAMPTPEQLGPVGAYLSSATFSWSSGNIVFSNGSEVAPIAPPRLLEVARTAEVGALATVFDTVIPAAFVPTEAAQQTNGASNARFAGVFDKTGETPESTGNGARSCLVVTDDPEWGSALCDALAARGVKCEVTAGAPATDFAGAGEQLRQAARNADGIDAVVVARTASRTGSSDAGASWQQVLEEHAGITGAIRSDVAWVRAVSDQAAASGRRMRIVTVTAATTSGGKSRAQAAAQLSRAAHLVGDVQADAFAISVETDADSRYGAVGELSAYLVSADDAGRMSGAELVATAEWIGLRSHPHPEASISFGGPDVPLWVDGLLRNIVNDSKEG
jgi:NAD(P)-dependent dehydrogenase (short-subunit alcohol dehydrogenase family)